MARRASLRVGLLDMSRRASLRVGLLDKERRVGKARDCVSVALVAAFAAG